jgi:hypothetical protein
MPSRRATGEFRAASKVTSDGVSDDAYWINAFLRVLHHSANSA